MRAAAFEVEPEYDKVFLPLRKPVVIAAECEFDFTP